MRVHVLRYAYVLYGAFCSDSDSDCVSRMATRLAGSRVAVGRVTVGRVASRQCRMCMNYLAQRVNVNMRTRTGGRVASRPSLPEHMSMSAAVGGRAARSTRLVGSQL